MIRDVETTILPVEKTEGLVPVEGIPGWYYCVSISPTVFSYYYSVVYKYADDNIPWFSHAAWLAQQHLFVHENGFLCVSDIQPGLSLYVHGGKWSFSANGETETRPLMQALFKLFGVKVLLGRVADGANPAQSLLDRLGFERTGIIPLAGYSQGKPYNAVLSALFADEGGN